MKTLFVAFCIILLYVTPAFSQSVDAYQTMYNNGKERQAILGLREMNAQNPKNLEVKKSLVNYYSWNEYNYLSKKEAQAGYNLSKNQKNEYPYFFYEKKTSNRFFVEGSYSAGNVYDTYGLFLESSHNYNKNDWLLVNFQRQTRTTKPTSQSGDMLGVGAITFLNKSAYLYSMFYFSPKDSFLPTYIFENELYYFKGNNTYSLNVKYNSYLDNTSLITLSPHFRHDFDRTYLGARVYLNYSQRDILTSYRVYGGYKFNYRLSGEAGYSFGKTKEDGITAVIFEAIDLSLKYKLTHSTDIGFKYIFYDTTSQLDSNTFALNLLWRY